MKPVDQQPCFWKCPDPTEPLKKEYHTSFALNADGDEIFLFDPVDVAANRFGAIHGVKFTALRRNYSLSLIPDGDRNGCWIETRNS